MYSISAQGTLSVQLSRHGLTCLSDIPHIRTVFVRHQLSLFTSSYLFFHAHTCQHSFLFFFRLYLVISVNQHHSLTHQFSKEASWNAVLFIHVSYFSGLPAFL